MNLWFWCHLIFTSWSHSKTKCYSSYPTPATLINLPPSPSPSLSPSLSPPLPDVGNCSVLNPFDTNEADELSIKTGSTIYIIDKRPRMVSGRAGWYSRIIPSQLHEGIWHIESNYGNCFLATVPIFDALKNCYMNLYYFCWNQIKGVVLKVSPSPSHHMKLGIKSSLEN